MKDNFRIENPLSGEKNNEQSDNSGMQWDDYKTLIKDMKFFDPHIHMTSLTTVDYQAMTEAGVVAIIEPAFRIPQSKTGSSTFKDYKKSLTGWERFKSSQFGIKHYCTIGINSKEANNEELAEQVLSILPLYLRKEGVVGVGEIGFEDQTKAEEKYFRLQLEMAKTNKLPIQIHTPHRDKKRSTERSMDICTEHGIDTFMVIIDHNTEDTIKSVLDKGYWAAFTINSHAKSGNERMVDMIQHYGSEKIMVNSAGGCTFSDSMSVPKTAALMKMKGISNEDIKKVTYQNAIDAFGQSGQIYLGDFQNNN